MAPSSGRDGPALGRREPRLPHGLELLPHPAEALLGLLRPLRRLALALLEGQHGGFGALGPLGCRLGAQTKSRYLVGDVVAQFRVLARISTFCASRAEILASASLIASAISTASSRASTQSASRSCEQSCPASGSCGSMAGGAAGARLRARKPHRDASPELSAAGESVVMARFLCVRP
jgi:hypothetical protein